LPGLTRQSMKPFHGSSFTQGCYSMRRFMDARVKPGHDVDGVAQNANSEGVTS
jgi:hypothetical protein